MEISASPCFIWPFVVYNTLSSSKWAGFQCVGNSHTAVHGIRLFYRLCWKEFSFLGWGVAHGSGTEDLSGVQSGASPKSWSSLEKLFADFDCRNDQNSKLCNKLTPNFLFHGGAKRHFVGGGLSPKPMPSSLASPLAFCKLNFGYGLIWLSVVTI